VIEVLDTGKLIGDARDIDLPGTSATLPYYAGVVDTINSEVAPTDRDDVAFVTRTPLDVVGANVPWNFPLRVAARNCTGDG
jgi:4-(gamma-glutamylamino)butanal dehydrogenase